MAIGLRRKVRLDSRRERQAITRNKNGAPKRAERNRRDLRLREKLAQQLDANKALSPDVQSWVSVQAGRPVSKLSPEAIKALLA